MVTKSRRVVPDLWRALAVILMVLYHAVFLGWYSFGWDVSATVGGWRAMARFSGWSFLFVAGWSAWLQLTHEHTPELRQKLFKRVWSLAAYAVGITLVTVLVVPSAPIWWGILHLMSSALAVTYWLLWQKKRNVLTVLGALAVVAGVLSRGQGAWWSVPLGWTPASFASLDYYPLAPYASLVWWGAALGPSLTTATQKLEKRLRDVWPGKNALLWIGQHSLAIYILHVPLLWIGLWLWAQI